MTFHCILFICQVKLSQFCVCLLNVFPVGECKYFPNKFNLVIQLVQSHSQSQRLYWYNIQNLGSWYIGNFKSQSSSMNHFHFLTSLLFKHTYWYADYLLSGFLLMWLVGHFYSIFLIPDQIFHDHLIILIWRPINVNQYYNNKSTFSASALYTQIWLFRVTPNLIILYISTSKSSLHRPCFKFNTVITIIKQH